MKFLMKKNGKSIMVYDNQVSRMKTDGWSLATTTGSDGLHISLPPKQEPPNEVLPTVPDDEKRDTDDTDDTPSKKRRRRKSSED